MSAGQILYANAEGRVFLKLSGDIRCSALPGTAGLSSALISFLDRLSQSDPFEEIFIDLAETSSIDSTHLGCLARVAKWARQHLRRKPVVVSTNPDITRILDSVGFGQIFQVVDQPLEVPQQLTPAPQSAGDLQPGDEIRLVLDAHQALVELNARNKQAFQDVVEMLQMELGTSRRRESPSADNPPQPGQGYQNS